MRLPSTSIGSAAQEALAGKAGCSVSWGACVLVRDVCLVQSNSGGFPGAGCGLRCRSGRLDDDDAPSVPDLGASSTRAMFAQRKAKPRPQSELSTFLHRHTDHGKDSLLPPLTVTEVGDRGCPG